MKSNKAVTSATFLVLAFLMGCMEAKHDPGSGKFSAGYGKLEPTFESINRKIFGPKCVSCHSGSDAPHGIDITTYEKIINGSVFPPLVVPGSPENSSLYNSVMNNSMPKDSQPLSTVEKLTLFNWIRGGALKVPGDDGDGKEPCEGEDCDEPCDPDEPCDDDNACEKEEPCEDPEDLEEGEPR